MNKIVNRLLFISIILATLAVCSCSSKKKVVKSSLRHFEARHLVNKIKDNEFDFNELQAKMSILFKSKDQNLNLKGQLRMKKDSIIWVSISLNLGLEVARVKITTDTICFINRLSSNYLLEPMTELKKLLPMSSFQMLQSVLVGNDSYLNNSDNYSVTVGDEMYKLSVTRKIKHQIKHQDEDFIVLVKNIYVEPDNFKIKTYNIKEFNDEKRKVQIDYGDFVQINEKYVPSNLQMSRNADESFYIEIKYNNITADKRLKYPFVVPKNFNKISIW